MDKDSDIHRQDWKTILSHSIQSPQEAAVFKEAHDPRLSEVVKRYPMRINPYFLSLCESRGEPLKRQVFPDAAELDDESGWTDPLAEDRDSPVSHLTHRYPDRVLFLVSNQCAVYCRYCTRKRKIGHWPHVKDEVIEAGVRYIAAHPEIKDVLLSGGDPLLLEDERLDWILSEIRSIRHVEIIRIGTRVPGVLPHRVTRELVRVLKRHHPLFMNVHFNHPDEITDEVRRACRRLADSGISLGSQTVLLRGINDDERILDVLFRQLLTMRIRPYYLLQADLTRGTGHFRTCIESGMRIMKRLRGRISGLAVPYYMIDLPGGGGKVPLLPSYIESLDPVQIVVKNFQDRLYTCPQPVPGPPEENSQNDVL
ncbi:KamA family radical SAM protein [bacterium]|nr:KamA family radical SAM protein [bacterium]